MLAPLPLGGLAAATAALAIAFVALNQPPSAPPVVGGGSVASEESFADMQELAETEALSAAVDHLEDFTDSELVCLIGL